MGGCAELLFPGLRKKNQALQLAASAQMAIDSVVVLRVRMHCPTCVSDVTSCLLSLNGVVDVHADPSSASVSVRGRALDAAKLSRSVARKTRRRCEIVAAGAAAPNVMGMGMLQEHSTMVSTNVPCPLDMHTALAPLAGTAAAVPAVSAAVSAPVSVSPATATTASHINPEHTGTTTTTTTAPVASVVLHHLDPSNPQHPAASSAQVLQSALPQIDSAQYQHQLASVPQIPLPANPSAADLQTTPLHEAQQIRGANAQTFYHFDESRKLGGADEPCLEIKQQIHSVVRGAWAPPATTIAPNSFQPSPYHPHHYATAPDHYYIGYTASEPRYRYDYLSDENPDACHVM